MIKYTPPVIYRAILIQISKGRTVKLKHLEQCTGVPKDRLLPTLSIQSRLKRTTLVIIGEDQPEEIVGVLDVSI